ncbi:glycosyltransferase family 2 protein [Acinetobacter vivianii]|uniref:glycosyltransferase family 2 protein n=1 Tax=Acinetobacter vivianii TaxID=1776742 RepID=UPI002DBFB4DE|nr:glycosyltransferase family 2 protein [Acinetobacter vivianii]MEB6480405.1 glycosyltransferase family 2 protein [Acinetobacter vivianii]MEB6658852.1 glycosyltransferase family 2 protein [Acinetobacter vivianii]
MLTYSIVIPVYNHPHYLADLVQHLSQFQYPIILVNDGSDAACTAILHQLAQHNALVDLVEHPENLGKGQAVITGLQHAAQQGMSHVLQIDADGQHCWDDVAKFIALSQQHPQAMVIGQPVFDASVPKKRLYGRYVTHFWVWLNSLSFEIKDSMCGFRIYPLAQTIPILNTARFQPRMGFDSEILVRLKWENIQFVNVPTKVIYPEHGISHFNVWRDNLGLSKAHARLFAGMLIRLPKLVWHKIKAD